jgi:hypothetical protein
LELETLGVRFAVVGGFGVSFRAEVRFTRDVDVAVVVAGYSRSQDLMAKLDEVLAVAGA